jgi:hypothetical protein
MEAVASRELSAIPHWEAAQLGVRGRLDREPHGRTDWR